MTKTFVPERKPQSETTTPQDLNKTPTSINIGLNLRAKGENPSDFLDFEYGVWVSDELILEHELDGLSCMFSLS